jgi:hypothetical protein
MRADASRIDRMAEALTAEYQYDGNRWEYNGSYLSVAVDREPAEPAKTWDVSLLVSLAAASYDEAKRQAEQLAEGLGMTEELSVSSVVDPQPRDEAGNRIP